tara:strand:+ start:1930 stop:2799 length:870 start_codon:yes stop_codon:yes gene_type:complete
MKNIPKTNQILAGSIIFAFGIFSMLSFLLLTLNPEANFDLRIILFVTIFHIILLEGVYYWLKLSNNIDVKKLAYDKKNAWTEIAKGFQYFDLFKSIIMVVVAVLLVVGVIGIGIYTLVVNPFNFSSPFYMFAGIMLGWLLLRIPVLYVLKIVSKPLRNFFGKALQTYTLNRDGFTVDLNIKNLGNPSKKYIVNFKFSEIDEIKELSFVEVKTFLSYKVGPDVDLTIRKTKDLYKYMKGEIDRPSVYVFGPSSIGTNVFFKGKDLFYLLVFDTKDVNDLLSAFEKYKKRK